LIPITSSHHATRGGLDQHTSYRGFRHDCLAVTLHFAQCDVFATHEPTRIPVVDYLNMCEPFDIGDTKPT
jgi:hypothetical protein